MLKLSTGPLVRSNHIFLFLVPGCWKFMTEFSKLEYLWFMQFILYLRVERLTHYVIHGYILVIR